MSGSNLLFIFTGSIACYKACDAVSRLVRRGHRVRTVATVSALKFIGPATLEGLTGAPVLSDAFAPGSAMEHINVTRWADAVIVCPATAHTINSLAVGVAPDLVGALFLAHDRTKPWLIAPAMNPAMWSHPATVAAVEKLQNWGVQFLSVGEGRTACGETGEGRLAEPAEIVAAVEAALTKTGAHDGAFASLEAGLPVPRATVRDAMPHGTTSPVSNQTETTPGAADRAQIKPARKLRVLVTSGGTSEPIDGVRVLTNTSTGGTGAGIASHLARCGHEPVLLRARHAQRPEAGCREETFESFADLDAALTRLLGAERFDAVIHAAAVGDFGIESVSVDGQVCAIDGTKLDSRVPPLLRLKTNPKLLDRMRALSPTPFKLIGFKLTRGASAAEARSAVSSLFAHSGSDWVVHNDLAARPDGAGAFPADIYEPDGTVAGNCADRAELAVELERLLVNAAVSQR
jgi:phosphopantothenoylcysteine decarboxylase/phosphopantothenate--cysteine ligase